MCGGALKKKVELSGASRVRLINDAWCRLALEEEPDGLSLYLYHCLANDRRHNMARPRDGPRRAAVLSLPIDCAEAIARLFANYPA